MMSTLKNGLENIIAVPLLDYIISFSFINGIARMDDAFMLICIVLKNYYNFLTFINFLHSYVRVKLTFTLRTHYSSSV